MTRLFVGFPFRMADLCWIATDFQQGKDMIEETVGKIEQKIRQANSISDRSRAELLELFARLKSEIDQLSETHSEEARSITSFTELSAHEATREDKNPKLL